MSTSNVWYTLNEDMKRGLEDDGCRTLSQEENIK
jgi:hypothetical protein